MRRELVYAVAVGGLMFAVTAVAAVPRLAHPACGGDPSSNSNGNHVLPSSLTPQPKALHNAYGAPIPQPIFSTHKRHKPKPSQPQLRSTALPAA